MDAVFRCDDDCIALKDTSFNSGEGIINVKKGERLAKKRDPVLEAVWKDSNAVNHTFKKFGLKMPTEDGSWVAKKARCPASGFETRVRLCPKCHKSLHSTFAEGKERRLTLLGAADSGKSNYIAVLVQEIGESIGSRLNFAFGRWSDDTNEIYRAYYDAVYVRGQIVEKTDRVRSRSSVVAPMVFGLQSSLRSGPGDILATFSFFDPPGEGLMNDRDVERFHKSVFNSDGLVLLIDGEKLLRNGKGFGAFTEATKVLEVVARRLDADRSWSKRLLPYLAIALSKSDLLGGLEDIPERALERPSYDRGFDQSDFRIVSSGVERLIRRNGGGNFCNIAQATFGRDHVGFFAVSAFGCAPDRNKNLPKVEPVRVVDPFLWLMSETGILADLERANR